MRLGLFLASVSVLLPASAQAAVQFVGKYEVAANATDLSGQTADGAQNRLSFGSDWVFGNGKFYGITDRGPGGGVLPFVPRVNEMKLGIDFATGAITSHKVVGTTLLKDADGAFLTGLNPLIATGNVANLGKSFDSEGFHLLPNGNYLIADEYGPSVYEFDASGKKLRAFEVPANLLPKTGGGGIDYVNGRPTIVTGRQDNRGYEGLTVSKDGSKAYAILQDPLVNEGNPDGRRGRFLRIVAFDTATGQSTGQYAYQLESLADINGRIPGTDDDFGANSQGRNIGVSSITALQDGSFLVIERDNRGLGVEEDGADPLPIGSKRVYRIRLDGATDISGDVLTGGALPAGAQAVQKELFVDVQAALANAGLNAVEKLEGLTFGPGTVGRQPGDVHRVGQRLLGDAERIGDAVRRLRKGGLGEHPGHARRGVSGRVQPDPDHGVCVQDFRRRCGRPGAATGDLGDDDRGLRPCRGCGAAAEGCGSGVKSFPSSRTRFGIRVPGDGLPANTLARRGSNLIPKQVRDDDDGAGG